MSPPRDFLDNSLVDVLFNFLHAAVLLLDAQGNIAYLNPAAERLLLLSSKLAKGKTLDALLRPGQSLNALAKEVVASGRTVHVHELGVTTGRGSGLIQVEIAPLSPLEAPPGALVWIHESTIDLAFQEESRLQDRLAMMGTLASGLAHEIRNPLGGIRAAAQMLSRSLVSGEDAEYSQMIIAEVDRLNHLITQLLDFAKPKKIKKGSVNVNRTLSELLALQKAQLERLDIQVKQEFDPSLPPVIGHEPSLRQAFLNLLKNAVEAMEKGGTLRVATGYISDYRMAVGEGKTLPMAKITISDTGVGIPQENLSSLFTPFFTTKTQGTGLGLMMTQRILQEHESQLRVSSKVGEGTTFKVLMKLAV